MNKTGEKRRRTQSQSQSKSQTHRSKGNGNARGVVLGGGWKSAKKETEIENLKLLESE